MRDELFHRIRGKIVVTGTAPDGDSVRFIADDLSSLGRVRGAERIELAVDRSVPLRLDGVDAPELQYRGVAQPLALAARDALLGWLGFSRVSYAHEGATAVVSVPGAIDVRGALVFPKLFRRCVDYLRDRAGGFRGLLTDWLRAQCPERPERVLAGALRSVPLHALVEQRGTQIRLHADTLDVAFVER